MTKPEILVIDDEREMLVSYERILSREGHEVQTFQSAEAALRRLKQSHSFSLIICDLKMPGMDGMGFLSTVKEEHPHLPLIMVTGYGTMEGAVEAVKTGAFDFIEKPFSSQKLLQSVGKALLEIVPSGDDETANQHGLDNMIGRSAEMKEIFKMITRVSDGNANVMITGESGVGKELVARSIHNHSLRRNRPIIPINCSALPDSLFESELFGYEKGAFTGAFQAKPGLVELANGGTLFLDEICEMSHNLQAKLLRTLEERKIWRIGGKKEIPVDIRVVTATNRDVEGMLANGTLREDFYYRINAIQIHIPPLRNRVDDIPLLIHHFMNELNQKYNRGIQEIEPSAMQLMKHYAWPGNVRELQNVIERTYYLANPPVIKRSDLPTFLTTNHNNKKERWKEMSYREAKDLAMEEFERKYLNLQLSTYSWNISRTAESCGMDRRTLHRLIKRYHLKTK